MDTSGCWLFELLWGARGVKACLQVLVASLFLFVLESAQRSAWGTPLHSQGLHTTPLDSHVDEGEPSIIPDSQASPTHVVDSQPVIVPPTSESGRTRAPPCQPARVAFLERHLIHTLVQQLLPRCHICGCDLTPRV